MKTFFPTLVLLSLFLGAAPAHSETEGRLDRLPLEPLREENRIGTLLVKIEEGDFVHPAFSPDGKMLAYARVVVRGKTELTEVLVRNLETGKTVRLLDAESSRRYAIYAAFVSALKWEDNRRLAATIPDGDVDASRVVFDVSTGKIVASSDASQDSAVSESIGRSQRWMGELNNLPGWPKEVLLYTLESGIRLEAGEFVMQKRYAGHDSHIWRLNRDGTLLKLLSLPKRRPGSELRNGFRFGADLLFLVSQVTREKGEPYSKEYLKHFARTAFLIRHRQGRPTVLASLGPLGMGRHSWLQVKHTSPRGVIFFIRTGPLRQRPVAPGLFYYGNRDGVGVMTRQMNPGQLVDVAVDREGRQIALNQWHGEGQHSRRRIVVHVLGKP